MHDRTVVVPALVQLRAERGMTMAALSAASGVSYSLVKYVHRGERQFSDVTAYPRTSGWLHTSSALLRSGCRAGLVPPSSVGG